MQKNQPFPIPRAVSESSIQVFNLTLAGKCGLLATAARE